MPAYLKILTYLGVAIAAGALVAPPVFWLGQSLAASGSSDWLAGFPFHRVLSRCLQVSLVVLLWPALRWIGLRRPSELGLRRNTVAWRDLAVGFACAVFSVGLVLAVLVFCGFSVPRTDPNFAALGRIVGTATVVSVLEEAVFRGVILGVCLWGLRANAAVLVSTLVFVVMHFVKPAKTALAPDQVTWFSGLAETLNFAAGLPSTAVLFFGAASLFVAGWILGRATVDTASLWLAIGLHAGWIFAVQTTNLFFKSSLADASARLPWVGPNLVSGAVPTGLLPLAGLLLAGWLARLYLRHAFRPAVPRAA
jgi:membrane protease YdiL (CAAX protease family)